MAKYTSQNILGVVLIVGSVVVVSLVGYFFMTSGHNTQLDRDTLCPTTDSCSQITAVLLDTTDPLSAVQQEFLRKELESTAESLPMHGKLELYEVAPLSEKLIKPIIVRCNPGRRSDTSKYYSNPELAERRWKERFMKPVEAALAETLSDTKPSRDSPIMEEIQQVAVQAFVGDDITHVPKNLVIVSDMLQNSRIMNQYRRLESFNEFRTTPFFVQVRPELSNVKVMLFYVRRSTTQKGQGAQHIQFWQDFFANCGATVDGVKSVSG